MSIVKPNCFEKTKVRWGIFKKLSCTNVDLEHVRPLATNICIYALHHPHPAPILHKLKKVLMYRCG